jgi:hypothetical protein
VTLTRVAWSGLAIIASVTVALVISRRRHRMSQTAANRRNTEWDLVDDFTQAVANALPHESGAFNVPPRPSDG